MHRRCAVLQLRLAPEAAPADGAVPHLCAAFGGLLALSRVSASIYRTHALGSKEAGRMLRQYYMSLVGPSLAVTEAWINFGAAPPVLVTEPCMHNVALA